MEKFLRFPDWKEKCITLSYDDGIVYDKKLVEILDKYSLKCTFNLNSGLFGLGDIRLSKEDAYELFSKSNHEIAIHGEKHLSLGQAKLIDGIIDISNDKQNLEFMYHRIVRGMAYANGTYNQQVKNYLKLLGISYARTCISTGKFDIPTDWLELPATCHHNDPKLMDYLDIFLNDSHENSFEKKPLLFYLWGHSYEYNNDNNWYVIENFAKKAGNRDDIWYATNIEIYDYVQAYNNIICSFDNSIIFNPSSITVFLEINDKKYSIEPGKNIFLE